MGECRSAGEWVRLLLRVSSACLGRRRRCGRGWGAGGPPEVVVVVQEEEEEEEEEQQQQEEEELAGRNSMPGRN